MDISTFSEIIKTIIFIYVMVNIGLIFLFWFIISSAVKHGTKKALEEYYDKNPRYEDFRLADESELMDW